MFVQIGTKLARITTINIHRKIKLPIIVIVPIVTSFGDILSFATDLVWFRLGNHINICNESFTFYFIFYQKPIDTVDGFPLHDSQTLLSIGTHSTLFKLKISIFLIHAPFLDQYNWNAART